MHANGKGVIKDGIKAHMWLSLAISSGCQSAIDKRDNIALDLTDDEIDEAGRMTNERRAQRP